MQRVFTKALRNVMVHINTMSTLDSEIRLMFYLQRFGESEPKDSLRDMSVAVESVLIP